MTHNQGVCTDPSDGGGCSVAVAAVRRDSGVDAIIVVQCGMVMRLLQAVATQARCRQRSPSPSSA